MNPIKCTCVWHIKDPEYSPTCEIVRHAEKAFEQRGWVMVCP